MFDLADAGALGFDADRLGRIAPFLTKTYIDNGRLPNAQLLVARDGQPVHYTRLGVMGDDQRELRDDALFRIASMTKPVTSVAFMQLVEQGLVALEEPVTKVFPEFADLAVYAGGGGSIPFAPGKPTHTMRFVDLLTHMSGFTYGLQNRNNIDAVYREHNFDFARDHLDSDGFIAKLAKLPLEFAPAKGGIIRYRPMSSESGSNGSAGCGWATISPSTSSPRWAWSIRISVLPRGRASGWSMPMPIARGRRPR